LGGEQIRVVDLAGGAPGQLVQTETVWLVVVVVGIYVGG